MLPSPYDVQEAKVLPDPHARTEPVGSRRLGRKVGMTPTENGPGVVRANLTDLGVIAKKVALRCVANYIELT